MDCSEEELTKINVFRLNILIPLMEILDVYASFKQELSPDEFCIRLFVNEGSREKCKPHHDPVMQRFRNIEEFKALSVSLQNVVIDLFMNIVRYAVFLESISKDYLDKQNCRNYNDLPQIIVFVYVLSYRICSLFFEDSIDCFVRFKVKKMLSLVAYLLRTETPNLFHEKGCLTFEEDFVEGNLVLPFLEATPCLEKLQEHLKQHMRNTKTRKKELTTPVFMNVLNRPRTRLKVPPGTPEPVEVKQTAASTLRECARVINMEEKEIKRLKSLAEGGTDPASILKFQEERRQQQKEEELLKIQEKHLLALLTRENAFIAKQSLLNDVKAHAESVRKEKQELYDKLEKWRENHNREMMEIVEKCREVEHASREAFNAMVDEKRQKAAEVTEESRQLKAQLVKQREEETRRKIKLIQEIKTLQSLRALPSIKDFDPTESSGLGLLCEMSLAELKERLFWTKMKLDEETKERKSVIHRERERQKNLINETRKALEEYKASKLVVKLLHIANYLRRAVFPMKSRQRLQPVSSPEIDALRKKLEKQKALRLQKGTVSITK
ncbi:uncharacterized protein LOC132904730 isoform X3 [Bombus pascuorum]|uniref:uncharacterized protein LOC132904730 isoform X3 n=1 Tax=Bombus pascuorum TaxID=65598 RepID=UPI00298D90F9|nr:uncharacterized protein LOC132904730 isoform X3 [Bombus pascuorum]